AATIFMADVIFCVDFTLLMRVRRSFRLGIGTCDRCHCERSEAVSTSVRTWHELALSLRSSQ
ncbi:MAG TPA: hypothetical protein VKT26_02940, partial [Acetobacteraceae bacterium]|nr:hypothetical protein [Acetobacteraceae bacterium]